MIVISKSFANNYRELDWSKHFEVEFMVP